MAEDIATPTKIEPTLTPIVDAPPLAAVVPEVPVDLPKLEVALKAEEPPKVEAIDAPVAPAIEAPAKEPPILPRAAQIAPEPIAAEPIVAEPVAAKSAPDWLRPGAAKATQPHAGVPAAATARSRFPLLAATVAIAASIGAIAGSFGAVKLTATTPAAETQIVARASKESTDEIKALKEMVTQLRAHTKTLSDNLAALKLSMSNTSAQLTKVTETLERRAAAPATAPETTGSIQKPATLVLGAPPAPLQHPIVPGWTLRRVYDGAALIEGREGIIEVETGTITPGLGRIEGIKRQDGRWVVVTSRGLVVGR
jgi:hypothetical protein